MFRSFFIFLSKLPWAQRLITRWKLAWRFASRFIAGEDRVSALEVVSALNRQGLNATLDFLGENVTQLQDAEASVMEILALLREIHQVQVRANVSIKLSQLGLTLDSAICLQNVTRLLDGARQTGNFLRIDMEDSGLTRPTIDLFAGLREQGYDNVGLVLQSYLLRTEADLQALQP
ncbi:MAG: proline dehydrogenase family protein, partial [Anaerolineaceae bacterium]